LQEVLSFLVYPANHYVQLRGYYLEQFLWRALCRRRHYGVRSNRQDCDRADELAQRESIGFAQAARRVMAADPALAKAYHAGEPYRRVGVTETPVHFSQLSEAEKNRHLPLRRLQPGERRDPNKTYLARMCSVDQGGGMFEVVGA
jgi:hypothetical protein